MFYTAKLSNGGVLPPLLGGKWTDPKKLSKRIDMFKEGMLPEQQLDYVVPFSRYKPNIIEQAVVAKR